MREFTDFLDEQFKLLHKDIQTPCGCFFITIIGISSISFPLIGYICMTSKNCVPYAGDVAMIIGISEDVLIVFILLMYLIKVCLRSCYTKRRQYISQLPTSI
jgi:hypothetical protein